MAPLEGLCGIPRHTVWETLPQLPLNQALTLTIKENLAEGLRFTSFGRRVLVDSCGYTYIAVFVQTFHEIKWLNWILCVSGTFLAHGNKINSKFPIKSDSYILWFKLLKDNVVLGFEQCFKHTGFQNRLYNVSSLVDQSG